MPPITVTVDASGNISCTPDVYTVPRNSGTVNIFWRMDTAGYEISDISGLPSSEFFGSAKNGGTGWKIQDKNDNVSITDYPYSVQVASTATGEVTEHDPIIRNGGQDEDLIP